jgi:hypothetical protein
MTTEDWQCLGAIVLLLGAPVATWAIRQMYYAKTLESKTRDSTMVGCPLAAFVFFLLMFLIGNCTKLVH